MCMHASGQPVGISSVLSAWVSGIKLSCQAWWYASALTHHLSLHPLLPAPHMNEEINTRSVKLPGNQPVGGRMNALLVLYGNSLLPRPQVFCSLCSVLLLSDPTVSPPLALPLYP